MPVHGLMGLDPTGTVRGRWIMRWKAASLDELADGVVAVLDAESVQPVQVAGQAADGGSGTIRSPQVLLFYSRWRWLTLRSANHSKPAVSTR